MNIVGRLFQKMKGQAEGTSASHARKRAYRIHSLFQKLGGIIFLISHY
jgi:hypothetical protein